MILDPVVTQARGKAKAVVFNKPVSRAVKTIWKHSAQIDR